MGTSLSREQKDKTGEQSVRMGPRRQALERKRSSLGREGQQRPCLKAVSSYLGEMTMLEFGLTEKKNRVWWQAQLPTARLGKMGNWGPGPRNWRNTAALEGMYDRTGVHKQVQRCF